MLFLLRHAKAGAREDNSASDRERGLTEKGRAQAEAIAKYLSKIEIDKILSSPYRRCVETVEPLANLTGLEIVEDSILGEDATFEGLQDIISHYFQAVDNPKTGSSVVICTHGNVVPAIIELIGLYSNDTIRCAKGSIYEIDLVSRTVSYREF